MTPPSVHASKSHGEAPTDHGNVKPSKASSWARYVASWPSWREIGVCAGTCPYAIVCGRARVCLDAHASERALVYALARLSERVGERAPQARTTYSSNGSCAP